MDGILASPHEEREGPRKDRHARFQAEGDEPVEEGRVLSSDSIESHRKSDSLRRRSSMSLGQRKSRMTAEEQSSQIMMQMAQTRAQVEGVLQQDFSEMEGHLDHSARLLNGLVVERNARELFDSESTDGMRRISREATQGLSDARQGRLELLQRLEREVERLCSEIDGAQKDEIKSQEGSAQYCQDVQAEVGNLYKTINQAKHYRLDKGEKLGEAVKQKLTEVEEAVAAERRFRLDSQNTLLELFGQMGQKMEQELEVCRRERLASTNRVLTVIETVLPRVEAARNSSGDDMTERVEDSGDAKAIARALSNNMTAKRGDIQKRKSILFKGKLLTS